MNKNLPKPKWPGRTTKGMPNKAFAGGRDKNLTSGAYAGNKQKLGRAFDLSEGGKPLQNGYSGQSANTRKVVSN